MSIAKNSSRPLAENTCSSLFSFGTVPFRAHVLQLLIVVYMSFAMRGQNNPLHME